MRPTTEQSIENAKIDEQSRQHFERVCDWLIARRIYPPLWVMRCVATVMAKWHLRKYTFE